ncbi:carboxylesterase [Seiridium cupressi]
MAEFDHPRLGSIKCIEKDQVLQFRGLKYASLAHAFADPKLFSVTADSTDATQHGKGPLPIFVFLHGGGFALGSNAWPQYDLARIVKYSAEIGKPVIGVQINYRLGIYGFLDSKTLRDAGVGANRGLRDQSAAFQWVKDNIVGFGGDAERVTAIGESAGGVSLTIHLQSKTPLFNQMVAMGGTSVLMKPLPPFVAEATYENVLKKLEIDSGLSSTEQLKCLTEASPQTVLTSIGPDVPLLPVADGKVIPSIVTFSGWAAADPSAQLPGTKWCHRAMLGDCQFDGSILGFALMGRKVNIATAFQKSLSKTLKGNEKDLESLLDSYKIIAEVSDDEALMNIQKFITDVHFYAPAIEVAKAWPGSAFLYHFNEPNPWDGPHKGESTHILDIAFLFQNYNEHLNVDQRKTTQQFARDFVTFVNGEDPYPVFSRDNGGAEVYGPPASAGTNSIRSKNPSDYGRRGLVWDLASSVGLDKLSTALDMFMAGQ